MFYLHMQKSNMRILKYKDFILEKIIPQPTDTTEEDSAVNRLNDMEKDINDFNKFKNEVETIYKNAKDSEDLNSKLLSFFKKINSNPEDQIQIKTFLDALKTGKKSRINFPNPLIEIWANLSSKKREIQKQEKQIDKLETEMGEESANTDPDTAELSKKEIEQDSEELQNKKKKIDQLGIDVKKLDKEAKDKLNLMKKELQKGILKVKNEREAEKVQSTQESKP